ncbi:hypothetical protein M3Y99_00573300 [Aphelenchoides fujianensis]|nr:hypothetical protein M3Y99_00573300 [Aphelenchoides fujianensis]
MERGKRIGEVIDSHCKYRYSPYTIVRIVDGRTKTDVSSGQLVEKGGVYAVELKEKDISIQLKVNDEEPKRVEISSSLYVNQLAKSQGFSVAIVLCWHPIDGYVQLDGRSYDVIKEGESYWLQTKAYPAIWFGHRLVSSARRLLATRTEKQKLAVVEGQFSSTAKEDSQRPVECWSWIRAIAVILLAIFVFYWFVVFLLSVWPPAEGGSARKEALRTTTMPTVSTDDRLIVTAGGSDELIDLLKEVSSQFLAERTKNEAEHVELQQLQQREEEHAAERASFVAKIGGLERQMEQLKRENSRTAPTAGLPCPSNALTRQWDHLVLIVILVLIASLLFVAFVCDLLKARATLAKCEACGHRKHPVS